MELVPGTQASHESLVQIIIDCVLSSIIYCDSTIEGDAMHTRVRIKGFGKSLWYRGKLSRFSENNVVSIIYRTIILFGVEQNWIILIDQGNLDTMKDKLFISNNFSIYQEN